MWKIFESDRVTMCLIIIALISVGIFAHELFFSSQELISILSIGANIATILAAIFGFWVFIKWNLSANNAAKHKLILDFVIYLQSLELVRFRLSYPTNKEGFIKDYDLFMSAYRELIVFRDKYAFLVNETRPSFIDLRLNELALLEGQFAKIRSIQMLACKDFDLSPSEGGGLLYEFLQGNFQQNGKYNRFHLEWTTEFKYRDILFSKVNSELRSLIHR